MARCGGGVVVGTDYEVSHLDTSDVEASDRPDLWREHVRFNHGGLDFVFERPSGFWGETVVQRSGELQLVEFSSDAITYERRARAARTDDDRSLRVLVPRTGELRVTRPDGEVRVGPGGAVAVSMTSAFALSHGAGARAWVVSVPESMWPRAIIPREPRVLDLRSGMGAVVASMTTQLSAERRQLSETDFREVTAALARLLAQCLADDATERWPELAQAAVALVRAQSDDPTLTPSSLARRLGWSLRQVQSVAQAAGTTPSEMIRSTRLARARARLDDPAEVHRSVADIAHASGFGSVSTFNGAFRDAYGLSPREARAGSVGR
ncbi:helix-turn-helix domain-containing protein [Aeromicrobium yanjiei]|uniref:Helix-turn-helix domain-containing protein n=1 Tax=Aeromicrobium yanjiei TaxID=2662028 RepID=A0A5Q2MME6_9ACTN|nr:helix-turn-helix domain-containing protein [Aeromicrobium yanjiei]